MMYSPADCRRIQDAGFLVAIAEPRRWWVGSGGVFTPRGSTNKIMAFAMTQKRQYKKPSKSSKLPSNPVNRSDAEHELNLIAEELKQLSRRFLRDNVLPGDLAGLEDDIRQDAILTAMRWYMRGARNEWHAPRSMAAALRIQKLRYARKCGKEGSLRNKLEQQSDAPQYLHPHELQPWQWPAQSQVEFIRVGIRLAAKCGRISHANASIARLVYCDQVPASEVAQRLKVSRGAISQQLRRVRHALPEVLARIEPTFD